MIKDSEKLADEDKEVKERVDAKNELESQVIHICFLQRMYGLFCSLVDMHIH
jgi:hypothetical protein